MPRHMHPHCVGTNHCESRSRSLAGSYWPGPVGLQYSPREVCTSVARGTLTEVAHRLVRFGEVQISNQKCCHCCCCALKGLDSGVERMGRHSRQKYLVDVC